MKCVIVGLSQFGKMVTMGLSRSECETVVIDPNYEDVERIKNRVTLAICAEEPSYDLFQDHDLLNSEILVAAIANNFEHQVLLVALGARMKIPRIVALARSPEHQSILEAVGAHLVMLPDEEAASTLVQRIALPSVERYIELHDGFALVEVLAPEELHNKSVIEIGLRENYKVNLVGLSRWIEKEDEKYLEFNPVPDPKMPIQEGDILHLAGSDLDLVRLLEL